MGVSSASSVLPPAYARRDSRVRHNFCGYTRLVISLISPVFAQRSTAPGPPHLGKVVVTLIRRSAYFLDGKRVSREQIEPLLAARVYKTPDLVAFIQCDKNQQFGRVLELKDFADKAGVPSVMFATPSTVRAPKRHPKK